jgi:hypothetical protein
MAGICWKSGLRGNNPLGFTDFINRCFVIQRGKSFNPALFLTAVILHPCVIKPRLSRGFVKIRWWGELFSVKL